jgi:hypothetical protein
VIICYTIAIALLLMSIIMYIEYIEKFISAIKKGFSAIVTPIFYAPKPPVRKKRAPQKRKPNKKNNKR